MKLLFINWSPELHLTQQYRPYLSVLSANCCCYYSEILSPWKEIPSSTRIDHQRKHCHTWSQEIKQQYQNILFLFIFKEKNRAVEFPSDSGTVIWLHIGSFHAGFLTVCQILYLAWKSEPVENLWWHGYFPPLGNVIPFKAAPAGDLI